MRVRSAFYAKLRRALRDIEGSDIRIETSLPQSDGDPTYRGGISVDGMHILVCEPGRDEGWALLLEWTDGKRTWHQHIKLRDPWYIGDGYGPGRPRLFATILGTTGTLVVVATHSSASYNWVAPACFVLKSNRWRLANKDLQATSSDDSGSFCIENRRLYVYQGNMDGGTRSEPQTYTLHEYKIRGTRLILTSSKQSKKMYDPRHRVTALQEFGLKRADWKDMVSDPPMAEPFEK